MQFLVVERLHCFSMSTKLGLPLPTGQHALFGCTVTCPYGLAVRVFVSVCLCVSVCVKAADNVVWCDSA